MAGYNRLLNRTSTVRHNHQLIRTSIASYNNNIMNSQLKVTISKVILGLFLSLGFFTPLVFSNFTAEAYEFPKMTSVYIVGSTIVFLWLLLRLLFGGKKVVFPGKEILLYLGIISLSTLFSSHSYTSVWGYYSRFNGGLVSFLIFFGIYLVGINFIDGKKAETLKDLICLSVFPVSLYGIFQIFEQNRISSTLGQPNWLAAYLVFLLPLLIDRILKADENLKKYFWTTTFLIAFINLWFAHSLSGLVGLAAGLVFLTIKFRRKVLNRWGLLAVFVFIIFSVFNISFFKERISDALTLSTDPQSYNVSDPGLIRLGLWKGSIRMAFSSPKNFLLGTGPETFPYQFPFFREDFLNYSSEWDFILNKPHNYYLEILVESGVVALVIYFLIMVRALKTKDTFLAAGLVGFYATNIFGWPTVCTSLLFWLWLVLIKTDTSP